ncbi:hypothetical protein WMY93_016466 [Mugilogobius chulae]|uniref:Uncharacterized protein n=1 Tax=Mugilogobius chulae TaxID=88201 RepID=A0AAW0NXN7_9GOBI
MATHSIPHSSSLIGWGGLFWLRIVNLQSSCTMLRESLKGCSSGSEAYSSDPEEDEEDEEDMVCGESDQEAMAEEMMDLSDLPTALFACNVHDTCLTRTSTG